MGACTSKNSTQVQDPSAPSTAGPAGTADSQLSPPAQTAASPQAQFLLAVSEDDVQGVLKFVCPSAAQVYQASGSGPDDTDEEEPTSGPRAGDAVRWAHIPWDACVPPGTWLGITNQLGTPLHIAAGAGATRALRILLIAAGATHLRPDGSGHLPLPPPPADLPKSLCTVVNTRKAGVDETPLHAAARGDTAAAVTAVKLLLSAGAVKSSSTIFGVTPKQLAVHADVRELLFDEYNELKVWRA